ncbi:MAG: ATP-binding cassette domain-containing protein [Spirochaetota bacterium]
MGNDSTIKISVRNLYKSFGNNNILQGINLDVINGEVLCVIGKSGTGKSVVMKHLVGILIPDSGEIFVDGVNFTDADIETHRSIVSKYGILFQGTALFDSMSVFENIAFGLRRKNIPEEEIAFIVKDMLGQVGLGDIGARRPSEISGGMQKRVGLARAIVMRPEIMLYDEPTTGVDPITAGSVDNLILEMREKFGITSIVVTHDMKSALEIADRIAMIYEGKIIFIGTPDEARSTDIPVIGEFMKGIGKK